MTEEQQFCIDVLEIVPDNSVFYVQVPSSKDAKFLKIVNDSQKYDWAKEVALNQQTKTLLKSLIAESLIVEEFNSVTIEHNEHRIFEGWDGMEIGEVSKTLILPNWFEEKYIASGYCILSASW